MIGAARVPESVVGCASYQRGSIDAMTRSHGARFMGEVSRAEPGGASAPGVLALMDAGRGRDALVAAVRHLVPPPAEAAVRFHVAWRAFEADLSSCDPWLLVIDAREGTASLEAALRLQRARPGIDVIVVVAWDTALAGGLARVERAVGDGVELIDERDLLPERLAERIGALVSSRWRASSSRGSTCLHA